MIVEQHPVSLLIPVDETAVFTCKAKCDNRCTVYWVINGTDIYDEQQHSQFQQMGFTFSHHKDSQNSSMYNTRLTVNATEAINNTNVSCVFENNDVSDHSLTATLQIIAGKVLETALQHNYYLYCIKLWLICLNGSQRFNSLSKHRKELQD